MIRGLQRPSPPQEWQALETDEKQRTEQTLEQSSSTRVEVAGQTKQTGSVGGKLCCRAALETEDVEGTKLTISAQGQETHFEQGQYRQASRGLGNETNSEEGSCITCPSQVHSSVPTETNVHTKTWGLMFKAVFLKTAIHRSRNSYKILPASR